MSIKKIVFVVAIALIASLEPTFAQRGGGGQGGGNRGGGQDGQSRQQLTPENIVTSTGLIILDAETVIKECKIKDNKTKKEVALYIEKYMDGYDNISFEFIPQIDSIKNVIPKMAETDMRAGMRLQMPIVNKIKGKTIPLHKELTDGVATVLSEKEKKSWESYYKKLCETNFFSTRTRQQRGGESQRPRE